MMVAISILPDSFRQGRHVEFLGASRHLMALDTTFQVLFCWPVEVVCFEPAVQQDWSLIAIG